MLFLRVQEYAPELIDKNRLLKVLMRHSPCRWAVYFTLQRSVTASCLE